MDEKDVFNKENKPESVWFKFEKVGDRISGELLEVVDKAPSGDFVSQRVWVLKTKDGETVNVGQKRYKDEKNGNLDLSYVAGALRNAKIGDIIGFEFEKEIPATTKKYSPAKSIQPYLVPQHKEQQTDAQAF